MGKQAGPSLPRVVSKNPQADALWRRQYEALLRGEVFDECLDDRNLQCLYYYPITLILGRVFEQMGRADDKTDVRKLLILAGRMIPYLGVRWQQSGKASIRRNVSFPRQTGTGH